MSRALLISILVLCCCKGDEKAAPIPDSIQGAYGRTDADAFYNTLGLEVDVDSLRFSELRLKIVAGTVVGTDSYQINAAELSWAKDDREPRKCKGTIARQGPRLLLSLFREESDAPCDATLAGDWTAWAPVSEVPSGLHGAFGRGDVYASAEGVRIEPKAITLAGAQTSLDLVEGVAYEGRNDHLIVRKATYNGRTCRGSISVTEDGLSGGFTAVEDEAEPEPEGDPPRFGYLGDGEDCPVLVGTRWSIDTAPLPAKPVTNGKVKVEIRGETVMTTTTDEQGLRCEQAILRTATRRTADSGRDGIPVMGGTVVVLTPAMPSRGAEGCNARLQNLAATECEALMGMPCTEEMLASSGEDSPVVRCPTHLVIGDPSAQGRKIAALPPTVLNAVCFEMAGHFTES
jgi:hypothetical protein